MNKAFKDLPEVRATLKPTLILVRHGSTDFDTPTNKIQGWLPGGLNVKGIEESRRMGKQLVNFPIRAIYTSDLDRAMDTADILWAYQPKGLGRPKARRMLRCWFMGSYQGKVKTDDMTKMINKLQVDFPNTPVPKGESFNAFKSRFLPALHGLLLEAAENPSEGFIVAVVHSDTLRLAHAWIKAGATGNAVDKATLTGALNSGHVRPGEAVVLTPTKGFGVEDGYKISKLKGMK